MRMVSVSAPAKLIPFFTKRKRFKVAIGGRAAGKSITFGSGLMMLSAKGKKTGCFREYKDSIKKSVYPLIVSQINKYQVPGFQVLKTEINHFSGGGFTFSGLARSLESIQSMHGYNFFWLEEGQFISSESLRVLTPTLRETGSELWISANPLSSLDPLSQRFILPFQKQLDKYGHYEDDLHLIVKINYTDNHWFPAALEQERQYDKIHLPRAMYDHIWLGAFNDSVEDSIITAEQFDAAINSHEKLGFKPTGIKVLSHDPSDTGPDDKALVLRHGSVVLKAESRDIGDVNEGLDWALTEAIERQVDLFTWDADGMGDGLKRQVNEGLNGKRIRYQMFYGSNSPDNENKVYQPVDQAEGKQKKNKDVFKNKRAQYYWDLRDRFYNTYLAVEKGRYIDPDKLISISPDIEDIGLLRSEVCRIPRVYGAHGKIQIMNKKDMLKLKIQSPNLADSLMMSFTSSSHRKVNNEPMVYDSYY